jgi:hypothetical protein
MKVDKLSISLEFDLGRRTRLAAKKSGKGLSGWIAEAISAKLRAEALTEHLAAWEGKHGPLKPADIAVAERALGLGRKG